MRYKVVVEITEKFDNVERGLSKQDKKDLSSSLNSLVQSIKEDGWSNKLYRRKGLIYPSTMTKKNSSLYMYKANNKYQVVLSVDNDPFFKQKIVTLYDIADTKNISNAFNRIASIIYNYGE